MNEHAIPPTAFRWMIALGSNLGEGVANLQRARRALSAYGTVIAASPIYETAPMYDEDQPRFYNAVLELQSAWDGPALLEHMQKIELEYGRTRSSARRYGPRAIDLDIVAGRNAMGEVTLDHPDLEIPHPRMHERAFVLVPMAAIVSQWRHPILLLTLEELLQRANLDDSLRIVCTPEQWA